jgi:hypothetical protein
LREAKHIICSEALLNLKRQFFGVILKWKSWYWNLRYIRGNDTVSFYFLKWTDGIHKAIPQSQTHLYTLTIGFFVISTTPMNFK